MIVIDAPALTNALIDDGDVGAAARAELGRDDRWASPEHFAVEVFSAVRRLHLGRKITPRRARAAVDALGELQVDVLATRPLLPRMWALRSHVSGYDAAYVAAAELLGCPLVTADARLAASRSVRCEVRLALPDR